MSFSYEEVGKENLELLNSLEFRSWDNEPIICYPGREWCLDKSISAFLVPIGSFRGETPYYVDLSYMGRIIRMETSEGMSAPDSFIFKINKRSIPESIWKNKEEIIRVIAEASKEYAFGILLDKNCNVNVTIACEPDCVEVDYNGR